MPFSDRLKALRIAKGMSQEALALACGWSGQSRIANYESSAPTSRQPKVSEVPLLARALGVRIAELFDDDPVTTERASHFPGIDPTKLAESIAALQRVASGQGKVFDPVLQPEMVVYAYELRCGLGDSPSTADVIDFGARLADRLKQRAEAVNGQSDGGQVGGADRKRTKGHTKS